MAAAVHQHEHGQRGIDLAGAVATRIARSTPVAAIVDCAMPTTTDGIGTLSRRALLALTCATPLSARGRVEDMLATDTATMLEDPANAVRGPVARTVQTSKLGVAVRRAVVKSAQFDDALTRGGTLCRINCAQTGAAGAQVAAARRSISIRRGGDKQRCGIDACVAARVSPAPSRMRSRPGATRTASLYEGKSAFGLETYAAFGRSIRFSKTTPQRRV